MSDPAIQLFEAVRRQHTSAAIDKAITMLLDLFRTAHGPLADSDEYSQADQLKAYAAQYPDTCALLHQLGLGKLLVLPAPDPKVMERWAQLRAGRTKPRRRK
jgi:hypothetical protein